MKKEQKKTITESETVFVEQLAALLINQIERECLDDPGVSGSKELLTPGLSRKRLASGAISASPK